MTEQNNKYNENSIMENNLCPICIEKSATYYTECGHGYCLECLSRIKKCSMCRKFLLREQLCIEIKKHKIKSQDIIDEEDDDSRWFQDPFSPPAGANIIHFITIAGLEYSVVEID